MLPGQVRAGGYAKIAHPPTNHNLTIDCLWTSLQQAMPLFWMRLCIVIYLRQPPLSYVSVVAITRWLSWTAKGSVCTPKKLFVVT
jgi:hypothetical protein